MSKRFFRGATVRVQFKLKRDDFLAKCRLNELLDRSARIIQHRYRFIRTNALLKLRQTLRRTKQRLAINIQRLFRARKSQLLHLLHKRVN